MGVIQGGCDHPYRGLGSDPPGGGGGAGVVSVWCVRGRVRGWLQGWCGSDMDGRVGGIVVVLGGGKWWKK